MGGPKLTKLDSAAEHPYLRPGLLIFERLQNKSDLVRVIEAGTSSPITHVGILDKKGDEWVVIEAFDGVSEVPLAQFIARSGDHYDYKEIRAFANDPQLAKRFVAAARSYMGRKYDSAFRLDNKELYCSELVAVAARDMGIDLFSGKMPVKWLNISDAGVNKYLQLQVYSGSVDVLNHNILPPNTLYYDNALMDIPDGKPSIDGKNLPANAFYDQLPGRNVDEKYSYLTNKWDRYIPQVQVDTMKTGNSTNTHFSLSINGGKYSITLFGAFPEEAALAGKICKKVNCK